MKNINYVINGVLAVAVVILYIMLMLLIVQLKIIINI